MTPVAEEIASPFSVSFDEVVRARSRRVDDASSPVAPNGDLPAEEKKRAEAADAAWRRFEESQTEVLGVYFGTYAPTGVALTRSRIPDASGLLGRLVTRRLPMRLHIAVDPITAGDAAELLSDCERAAIRADQFLSGSERERVIRVIYERLCQVIRTVDAVAKRSAAGRLESTQAVGPSANDTDQAAWQREQDMLRQRHEERRKRELIELKAAETVALRATAPGVKQAADLCYRAVRRRATMAYFDGMLLGALVFTGVGIVLGHILAGVDISGFDLERFLTTFIAGAVGAIVSVMTRMSGSEVTIDYETGRGYLAVLGAFRPLIGAIFGVALYFGISSGILQAAVPKESNEVFFYFAFISFLAGFSERWAKDTVVAGRNAVSQPQ